MSRRLLAAAGILTVVLGFVWLIWPVGHIPLFDANLVRLAESDLQGYCAGETFWKTSGEGSASGAAECRSRLKAQHKDVIDLQAVQPAFCQAIVDAGWEGSQQDCLGIMVDNQYWPTYDGGITNQWNRARKYPLVFHVSPASGSQGGSRTGGHGANTREDSPSRAYYPGG
jgi:hypothetical protein